MVVVNVNDDADLISAHNHKLLTTHPIIFKREHTNSVKYTTYSCGLQIYLDKELAKVISV